MMERHHRPNESKYVTVTLNDKQLQYNPENENEWMLS